MPTFVYQAMDRQGKEVKGEVPASSQEEAINLVRKKGLYPTMIKQKSERRSKRSATTAVVKARGRSFSFGGVNRKMLTQFTRQFSTLQDAGLPIVRSLQILEGQMKAGILKNALMDVTEDVQGGTSLSESFAKHPKVFDKLYINMVRAGEAGGVLDVILQRLALFMEKSQKLKARVKSALVYPTAVVVIAAGILTFIMAAIIPKFQKMFDELGVTLPLMTQVLIGFSNFVKENILWMPILPVLAIVGLKILRKNEAGQVLIDRAKLKMPLFGMIIRKATIARFSRTLGTLIQSGVAILEALSIVKGAAGNAVIANAISDVHSSIREGDTIAEPLRQSGCFDEIVINMIEVGEETGDLDKMLIKVADNYDEEVDNAVGSLMSLFEPLLIVLMGFAVGFIVIALFLPLVTLMDSIGAQG
ncbi:MAG: type II secretion system F family protein [Planctomycetes bacterium]|nr:type II secretion system F family protein [Planctomycetota bacterium]